MGTPAVGSQITFSQVYNFFTGSTSYSNLGLRGTLGANRNPSITTGQIRLSADCGGQDLTYTVSSSAASANEGDSLTFTTTTKYVANGTTLYYTLSGVNTRDLDAANYTYQNTSYSSSGATGYGSIVNKVYTRLLGRFPESTVAVDYHTNNFLIDNYNTLNQFLADVANQPEYATLEATPTETGTFSVSSGSASKTFTVTPDRLTEGTESLTFQVRTGSHSGTLVGTTIVSLNDTYTAEGSPSISSFSSSTSSFGIGGGSTTLSWSTSNADVVRLYKNGSIYKHFNSSTTSVSETVTEDCTFSIQAWNSVSTSSSSSISHTVLAPITISSNESNASVNPSGNHVLNNIAWYKFILGSTRTFTATTAPTTNGYDTEIALYNSSGNLIVKDDDSAGNLESQIPGSGAGSENAPSSPVSLSAGTYYLAVGLYNCTFNSTGFSASSNASLPSLSNPIIFTITNT